MTAPVPTGPPAKPAPVTAAPSPATSSVPLPKPTPPRRSHPIAQEMSGATSLVRALEAIGVDTVFGIPGGAILPAYEPLLASTQIRHILVRHEQGAGHAAEGYALASGRVGVCISSSGPGATNLVTPIANAYMDSTPMVAITGQVPSRSIGTDAFQEADIRGITMPITKHSYLVTEASEIAHTLSEAFHIAGSGRPGPVLVDIATDALRASTTFRWPQPIDLPGYRPTLMPHGRQVREAAKLILEARRPVLLIGGGVLKAGATAELYELAKLTAMPVVTTLMARGAYPDSDPQHLGMAGMHGSVPAVAALQRADVIVALGTRLDDRVTGRLATFAPKATVVHADIDPAEISKNRHADVPIVGDCRRVVGALVSALREEQVVGTSFDNEEWWATLDKLRSTYPLGYDDAPDGVLAPQLAIKRLGELIGPEAIYVSGVGQHQVWAAQYIGYERPGTWLNSGGLGTMGFAVPAAMGAKLGRPAATVWAIDGDGCFQMTSQELTTCALEGIPIKVAVINNDDLGMINRSRPDTPKSAKGSSKGKDQRRIPDFVRLADAYGCVGLRCDRPEDLDKTIEAAMAIDDRPVVVDFIVRSDSMTWPMVSATTTATDIQAARDLAPDWDREGE